MFVRFQQKRDRLLAGLIENRRLGGKVVSAYVAGLGSIATPPTVADRIAFWSGLHQRLGRLGNRISPDDQAKILGSLYAKIPMPSADEQRSLQLQNAKADADFWSCFQQMQVGIADDSKGLSAEAERKAEAARNMAADAESKADAARDRIARIEHDEDVDGGLGKPLGAKDFERMLIDAGMTKSDLRRSMAVAEIYERDGEKLLVSETVANLTRAEDKAVRKVLNALRGAAKS